MGRSWQEKSGGERCIGRGAARAKVQRQESLGETPGEPAHRSLLSLDSGWSKMVNENLICIFPTSRFMKTGSSEPGGRQRPRGAC